MIEQCDALHWLRKQPVDSLDLVFSSPPYVDARLYLEGGVNIGIARSTHKWVDWMAEIYMAALDACKGLVAFVVEGRTHNFSYNGAPLLLAAELLRRGVTLRKPPIFHRIGIAGSGGPDWLRNDYEFIVCATNGGKLPWSDNTACGHEPKYAPGGAMSYRNVEGARHNEQHKKYCRAGYVNGDTAKAKEAYVPPKLANPGNEIQQTYTAREVEQMMKEENYAWPNGDTIHCKVGGGVMGSRLCHENEAPFPEALAEFFIKSFCQPGGVVADPFSGSGTTVAVAKRLSRIGVGCDLRRSQVELTERRLAEVV